MWLLWLCYIIWPMGRDFEDVIKVPNHLTSQKGRWPWAASVCGFTVTAQAWLASVITSFRTRHILKGNGAWLNLGLLLQQLGSRPCLPTGWWQSRSSEGALPLHPARLLVVTPTKRMTASTLRRDMAGMYTQTRPWTKDTGFTQSKQRYSHIKTTLQGHSS